MHEIALYTTLPQMKIKVIYFKALQNFISINQLKFIKKLVFNILSENKHIFTNSSVISQPQPYAYFVEEKKKSCRYFR